MASPKTRIRKVATSKSGRIAKNFHRIGSDILGHKSTIRDKFIDAHGNQLFPKNGSGYYQSKNPIGELVDTIAKPVGNPTREIVYKPSSLHRAVKEANNRINKGISINPTHFRNEFFSLARPVNVVRYGTYSATKRSYEINPEDLSFLEGVGRGLGTRMAVHGSIGAAKNQLKFARSRTKLGKLGNSIRFLGNSIIARIGEDLYYHPSSTFELGAGVHRISKGALALGAGITAAATAGGYSWYKKKYGGDKEIEHLPEAHNLKRAYKILQKLQNKEKGFRETPIKKYTPKGGIRIGL